MNDTYHLYRGLELLRTDWVVLNRVFLNDPPVGEAISAIPAWLNGVHLEDNLKALQQASDVPPPDKYCYTMPDSLRDQTMIWKAILFLPAIAVIFQWVAEIYSIRSAWLATALVLVEPNIAAHLPLPTVDVIGMEGISDRLLGAVAVHPAADLWANDGCRDDGGAGAGDQAHRADFAAGGGAPGGDSLAVAGEAVSAAGALFRNIGLSLLAGVIAYVTIWVLCAFDFSRPLPNPLDDKIPGEDFVDQFILPAGIYFKSLFYAMAHAKQGNPNYLWGEVRWSGWWYYFPVLAGLKFP